MPAHIKPFNNQNKPLVDDSCNMLQRSFFNRVVLAQGETFHYQLAAYESCCVVARGSCDIRVEQQLFYSVGQRQDIFSGKPDSVFVPPNCRVELHSKAAESEIYVAGGRAERKSDPFRVSPDEVDVVQYGSDETKTHRKIYHILGQHQAQQVDKLLVSELFTVGKGGWSGFPPHKHHVDRLPEETDHEEIYHFKFNPPHGFGAQFVYTEEDDFGPVYHIKDGSTVLLDKSYHPSVVAPNFLMYYFTILVGKSQRSLVQYFQPEHREQLKMIPGIMDMVNKFK